MVITTCLTRHSHCYHLIWRKKITWLFFLLSESKHFSQQILINFIRSLKSVLYDIIQFCVRTSKMTFSFTQYNVYDPGPVSVIPLKWSCLLQLHLADLRFTVLKHQSRDSISVASVGPVFYHIFFKWCSVMKRASYLMSRQTSPAYL